MNKAELIDYIARDADVSKAAATRALDAAIEGIKKTLKRGGSVSIVGFGTYTVHKRSARMGRNPRTGEPVPVKETTVAKFRPGKAFKDALNG